MGELYIGIMSGTSIDAADAVLVDFSHNKPELLAHLSLPWPAAIRTKILTLAAGGSEEIEAFGDVDILVARHFAELTAQLLASTPYTADDIRVIGCHGQTIRHRPNATRPFTIQIGDPNTLAEKTGIAVACDFRRRDLAAGGQGAPLVPAFHQAVFAHPQQTVVALNLGGIANISVMHPGKPIRGYDTGPANMLLDAWCLNATGQHYDENGDWAASGEINDSLLKALLAHPYLQRPAPKSTGREEFGLSWLNSTLYGQAALEANSIQATLCELTAISVAEAIKAEEACGQLVLCGGGAFNGYLVSRLQHHLPTWQLCRSSDYGIDPQWVEACAFAWLAKQLIDHQAGNVPTVTGADRACVLGGIYPGKVSLKSLFAKS
ncbi:MAG: anhydro-N-acetylmuramic acid kinase [Moraxellaceae bacterium]|nr:anhydro-N-acetylmuramic acid kinase [Moraxellaceae bacterium]MDZ4387454.1 anhydro-N-acetylmuramic acid kinase [Moraxellaceae bacterium]